MIYYLIKAMLGKHWSMALEAKESYFAGEGELLCKRRNWALQA